MSNFLLPKNNIINANIHFSLDDNITSINKSIMNYYINSYNEIQQLLLNNSNIYFDNYDKIIKIINPYEYIYSNIPGTKYSVSKLKSKSLLFYDLVEINTSLDLFSFNKNKKKNILNIGPNNEDFIYYIDMMIEEPVDIVSYSKIDTETYKVINNKYDFIYFEETINVEMDIKSYINTMIKVFLLILKCQENEGVSLIKIDNLFYKPIIEILYLFSSFFESVYIIKPTTSNMATSEKYIVCKKFLKNKINKVNIINNIQSKETNLMEDLHYIYLNKVVTSIIENEIPCYFLNKINDLNSILVQQQLESMEQIVNILKTKNKEDKIELLQKNNINKAVLWCEKFKIPYNKILDKTNIFLHIIKNKSYNMENIKEYKEQLKEEEQEEEQEEKTI